MCSCTDKIGTDKIMRNTDEWMDVIVDHMYTCMNTQCETFVLFVGAYVDEPITTWFN